MFWRLDAIFSLSDCTTMYCDYPQSLKLKTASKRQNMFYQNKKKETTEIGMSLNLPNSESELRNEADLIESRLTSTSFFHMYNEAPPNKIRCLPLLFTKGMPTALDDFSLEELKCFLPYLIGVSAKFEGRNVWSTPPWWDQSIVYSATYIEVPPYMNEEFVLRSLILKCYAYHDSLQLVELSTRLAALPMIHLKFVKSSQNYVTIILRNSNQPIHIIHRDNLKYDLVRDQTNLLTYAFSPLKPKEESVIVISDTDDESDGSAQILEWSTQKDYIHPQLQTTSEDQYICIDSETKDARINDEHIDLTRAQEICLPIQKSSPKNSVSHESSCQTSLKEHEDYGQFNSLILSRETEQAYRKKKTKRLNHFVSRKGSFVKRKVLHGNATLNIKPCSIVLTPITGNIPHSLFSPNYPRGDKVEYLESFGLSFLKPSDQKPVHITKHTTNRGTHDVSKNTTDSNSEVSKNRLKGHLYRNLLKTLPIHRLLEYADFQLEFDGFPLNPLQTKLLTPQEQLAAVNSYSKYCRKSLLSKVMTNQFRSYRMRFRATPSRLSRCPHEMTDCVVMLERLSAEDIRRYTKCLPRLIKELR